MAELIGGAIVAIGTAAGSAAGAVAGAVGLSSAAAGAISFGTAFATSFALAAGTNLAVAYGLSKATSALFGGGKKSYGETLASPTYGFGATQGNSNFSIPMVYGEVKMFGNVCWQKGTQTVHRFISFGDGEIEGFSDIRLNDIPVDNIVGASYTAYMGDGEQDIDDRVPGTTQEEKAEVTGGLKYDAYLAFTITANEQVNGNFRCSAIVKGKKVRVYTDINNYTVKWSNNPAWCLADFMTGYNSGGLSYDNLDLASFLESASYCDEILETGEKRFTLNIAADAKQSSLEWVLEILKAFRGNIVKRQNKWRLFIDKPEPVSQKLSGADIRNLKVWWLPMDEIFDIVNIKFRGPDYDWVFVPARAEADDYLRKDRPFEKNSDLLGVTNFNQASRLSWYYLRQSQVCQMFLSFEVSGKCMNRTVGDVIELTDYIIGFSDKKYRIIKMNEAQDDFIQLIVREYNEAIYEDTLGSVEPTINILKSESTRVMLSDASGYITRSDERGYVLQSKSV